MTTEELLKKTPAIRHSPPLQLLPGSSNEIIRVATLCHSRPCAGESRREGEDMASFISCSQLPCPVEFATLAHRRNKTKPQRTARARRIIRTGGWRERVALPPARGSHACGNHTQQVCYLGNNMIASLYLSFMLFRQPKLCLQFTMR